MTDLSRAHAQALHLDSLWEEVEASNYEVSRVDEVTMDDPSALRALFVVGGGGSGKGRIITTMLGGRGFKHINQDRHLERFYTERGMPLSDIGRSYGLFKKAQALARKERNAYAENRSGLIIDITGWDYKRVAKPVHKLRELGYDCSMIFVSVTEETALDRNWKRGQAGGRLVPKGVIKSQNRSSHANIPAYRLLFGKDNFVLVKNDADIDDATWTAKVTPILTRVADRLLSRPIKNPIGRAWIRAQVDAAKAAQKSEATVVLPAWVFG